MSYTCDDVAEKVAEGLGFSCHDRNPFVSLRSPFDLENATMPFLGYKQSGQGGDKCLEGLLSYTQTKSAWTRRDSTSSRSEREPNTSSCVSAR